MQRAEAQPASWSMHAANWLALSHAPEACSPYVASHQWLLQGDTLGKLRHGRGVHTCANGDRYEGRWRYDKRDGTGKMTFVRGVKYEGDWKDDKAHG